jgi:hypothetical protein
MIDAFAMVSTTLCILYVTYRAMILDRTTPWFEDSDAKIEHRKPAGAADDFARPVARRPLHEEREPFAS